MRAAPTFPVRPSRATRSVRRARKHRVLRGDPPFPRAAQERRNPLLDRRRAPRGWPPSRRGRTLRRASEPRDRRRSSGCPRTCARQRVWMSSHLLSAGHYIRKTAGRCYDAGEAVPAARWAPFEGGLCSPASPRRRQTPVASPASRGRPPTDCCFASTGGRAALPPRPSRAHRSGGMSPSRRSRNSGKRAGCFLCGGKATSPAAVVEPLIGRRAVFLHGKMEKREAGEGGCCEA